jgi:hypothetical protein
MYLEHVLISNVSVLYIACVNVPDDYLFMYVLHGAGWLFLLCCVSKPSRLRVSAKPESESHCN